MPLQKNGDIVINNWSDGVAPSPETGIADIRNADINSLPGEIFCNNKSLAVYPPAVASQTFTAVAATDIITVGTTFGYTQGITAISGTSRAVTLSTTDTLPSPLVAGTIYYLIQQTATTYKLATSVANAETPTPIDITDTGTGTHSIVSLDMGKIKHFARDERTDVTYALDDNGRVWEFRGTWELLAGNTVDGTSQGNGLVVWKNYLFVFRQDEIDVYGDLSAAIGSRAWVNAWQSLNAAGGSTDLHHAIGAQDDAVYFCDNRYVGSILEATGSFDPNTGSTFTYNNQALTLPQDIRATRLTELGTNLLIGTDKDKIFPWNRIDVTFNPPLFLNEENTVNMVTRGNLTYIFAGNRGNIYFTDGVEVKIFKSVSEELTQSYDNNVVTFGGAILLGKKLVFGVKTAAGDSSGVYSINLSTKSRAIVLENIISTGSVDSGVEVPALIELPASTTAFYVAFVDGSVEGIDRVNSDRRYAAYETFFITELYKVGSKDNTAIYENIAGELAKALRNGEGVRVSYRLSLQDSFTQQFEILGTAGNDNTIKSFSEDFGVAAESIQFKVELKTTTGTLSNTRLKLFKVSKQA